MCTSFMKLVWIIKTIEVMRVEAASKKKKLRFQQNVVFILTENPTAILNMFFKLSNGIRALK